MAVVSAFSQYTRKHKNVVILIQAFLIAFTSEFIAKLVYKYEHDWNMKGYVNFTLSSELIMTRGND